MHLIIPFASVLSEAGRQAMAGLALPNLKALLSRLQALPASDGGDATADEYSLTPPHERALADALGWRGDDGCLPWAARAAAQDGIDVAGAAWGLVTPAHWRVGSDQVHLLDPAALQLQDADSRQLFDALRELFDSDDAAPPASPPSPASPTPRFVYGAPLRWYWGLAGAAGLLDDLPCASLDRVVGRPVDLWLGGDGARANPRLRTIRRLQSEAQMLLHQHPLNEARESAGLPAVNSFWLSGCGRPQPALMPEGLVIDHRLRRAALQEDWAAWQDDWQALDAGPIATLLDHVRHGKPASLTLCGERRAQRFDVAPARLWARLAQRLHAPAIAATLDPL